jgi:hypothetical protein
MADTADYLIRQIDDFIAELKRDVKNSDIDASMAQNYAEFFNRSISTRVTGTITVTFEVAMDLEPGTDKGDLDPSDFDASIETGWATEGICIDSADVTDFDFDLEYDD